jgi:subtilisin family serine protease
VTVGPPRNRGQHNDANYEDDFGHGTHVAGTAAARDQGWGYIGVAPGARLWAVKVLDAYGGGYVSDITAGVDWVVQRSDIIEVANMSLGWQGGDSAENSALRTAIQGGVDAGVVFVVAAGNDAQDVYGPDGTFGTGDDFVPAAYPEVAAISAFVETDGEPGGLGSATGYGPDDSFASFSNYSASVVTGNPVSSPGAAIDLTMPGVDVWSTHLNNDWVQMSGTSMASPHAAGLAALYIAQNGRAADADGVYAIRQALIDGAMYEGSGNWLAYPDSDPDDNAEGVGWAGDPVANLAPTVEITSPMNEADLWDVNEVPMTATAVPAGGTTITQVEFFVEATSVGTDTYGDDGWSSTWNTAGYADGPYTITAEATAEVTATGELVVGSDAIRVYLDNVDEAPTVTITSPEPDATVSGTVTVTAAASDDRGVAQVDFLVDGTSIGTDAQGADGWSITWDTTVHGDGSHVITAVATDSGTNTTTSDPINVTVDNSIATMTADLEGWPQSVNRNFWRAWVSVTIVDGVTPLQSALVTGTFSWNGSSLTLSGTTDPSGQVTFSTGNLSTRRVASVDFVVDSVVLAGYEYGDSDSITILKPDTTSRSADLYDQLAIWQAVEHAGATEPKERELAVEALDYLMAYQM